MRSQLLSGLQPPATAEGIFEVARQLGSLQVDPIAVVQRTHLLVPFSRIGPYDTSAMSELCWRDKRLFTFWAHAASLVPTEQYPIHRVLMRRFSRGLSPWGRRLKAWVEANPRLKRHVLLELRRRGPLLTRHFIDHSHEGYVSGGWNEGRNVDRMLDYLWTIGIAAVAGRDGIFRVWDLAERWLPEWTPREVIRERAATRRSVEIALRALGVATPQQIKAHFTRGRYWHLDEVLAELVRKGRVVPVRISDDGHAWRGDWYAPAEIEAISRAPWEPRTTLLSPFDNLICDRARTKRIFGFDYTMEIYVPKSKRRYGYYVLPILHGDALAGRIDPAMDRKTGTLRIEGAWIEPGRDGTELAQAAGDAIKELARFLDASSISVGRKVPASWRRTIGA